MKHNATVKAIEFKDVRGKIMWYLHIENNDTQEEILINVGQKTYERVTRLTNEKQLKPQQDEEEQEIKIEIQPTDKEIPKQQIDLLDQEEREKITNKIKQIHKK